MEPVFLSVRGAREHNLKNITVNIPRNKLTVITGLSGSGKSSLAFDTIYAEGQRRYVESLSAYARQFLELMQKPDVDMIEGLSPAISIEQKTTSKNPRSTVGTVTEIYDYLRLLFARIGVPYSPATNQPIKSQTISEMVDRLMAMEEGTRLYLLAPVVRGRKGEYKKELLEWQKKGFQRFKIDNELYDADSLPKLDKALKHDIYIVVDRIVIKKQEELTQRLAASLETCLSFADGLAFAENADPSKNNERIVFSEKFSCPESGFTIEEIEPRLFSFNSPFGACPTCDGLGSKHVFDENLIVPDGSKSIFQGAITPWFGSFSFYYNQILEHVIKFCNDDPALPFNSLEKKTREMILYGSGKTKIPMELDDSSHVYKSNKPFEGVIPNLERRYRDSTSENRREELASFQNAKLCDSCKGMRLKPEALAVKIDGKSISEITALSLSDAAEWFKRMEVILSKKDKEIAYRILKEINDRIGFLNSVGLGYLHLCRASGTLSGGESQRIRLASQIGSGLTGVLYILDEPSIGLHQRDNDRLIATLKRLRDLGNTVIVVEHDEDTIREADFIIDMGPGAGRLGGEVVAAGSLEDVLSNEQSLTAAYMSGRQEIAIPEKRRDGHVDKAIKINNAHVNNLKNISVDFPLGKMVAVTGVSGGGKSSLVIETLYKGLAKILNDTKEMPGAHDSIEGVCFIDKIIDIDQSPIGRTPRSNPATYTGAFSPIRDWFAGLPEAKARAYGPGRFSFNVKGGRCEACQGDGVLKIEMHFLPDVYVECDKCHGKRYNRETLEIKHKGLSISDVLDLTVDEGVEFFINVPSIHDKLKALQNVGLGYIHIGQRATTLSGGEAQRIKLAKELSKRATGRTFYILDEPTTGLHFEDVRKLLEVLHKLVDQGNTVVVIEHNLEVIKTADWIIDVGPEGGDGGGSIVAFGTPEEVCENDHSFTGKYLKKILKNHK